MVLSLLPTSTPFSIQPVLQLNFCVWHTYPRAVFCHCLHWTKLILKILKNMKPVFILFISRLLLNLFLTLGVLSIPQNCASHKHIKNSLFFFFSSDKETVTNKNIWLFRQTFIMPYVVDSGTLLCSLSDETMCPFGTVLISFTFGGIPWLLRGKIFWKQ